MEAAEQARVEKEAAIAAVSAQLSGEGFKVECMEGADAPPHLLIMKYRAPDTIKLSPRSRFGTRLASIHVPAVLQCLPGAYHKLASDENTSRCITLEIQSPDQPLRHVYVLLSSEEERDATVGALW